MATSPTDFLRLHLDIGVVDVQCLAVGVVDWPPPKRIYLDLDGKVKEPALDTDSALIMERIRYFLIPDELANHPNITRGAEYRYLVQGDSQ